MAAQRQNASARPPDVAQQELQDGGRPDHLHPGRVLRPADRITDGAGALRPGVIHERLRHLEERLARRATYLFDQFRRIALVVLLQDLEDTTRMLQGWVLFGARPDQLADLGTE